MFGFKLIYGKLGDSLLKVLEAAGARVENAADVALDLDKARQELSAARASRSTIEEELKRLGRESEHKIGLQKQQYEAQIAAKREEFERREREIEHMLGLERKRQEFEMESAKREATLAVREENLKADRKRFDEQMDFHDKRFTEEVGYLKEMISTLAERLPTAHNENVTIKGRE